MVVSGQLPRAVTLLERYVPRTLSEWDVAGGDQQWRRVDGTLCFVDISGFTKLSEQLARRGRIGAEELTEVLNRVFGEMLRVSYERGGGLLKFGGDALLLLFEEEGHAVQAASAAIEMRAALRQATQVPTSAGRVRLRMSVGVHTGAVDLFRVGTSHEELVVTGPAATMTAKMEHAASADQILVSRATRALLPPGAATARCGPGYLLGSRRAKAPPRGAVPRLERSAAIDICIPLGLRTHLADPNAEPEHRVASVAFVRFGGVDQRLRAVGPERLAADLHALMSTVQECVDDEGVTFLATDLDTDGGKVILVAGVPRTEEDDAGRILRASRRIADAELAFPLQIGVHRDHVFAAYIGTEFRSTYTVMGDTVNLAARLMATAPPGQIYASPTALDDSRALFAVQPLEPFSVKGKAAPVHAYAVGAPTGVRSRRSSDRLPFVGRVRELEALRADLDRAGHDRGAVVTLVGDAGIGKSRLLEEALAVAPDRRQLTLRAEPNGADTPYWLFRDPLRSLLGIDSDTQAIMATRLMAAVRSLDERLLPALPLIGDVTSIDVAETPVTEALAPRFRPDRTADVVLDVLDRILDGPATLVVEDAHWLDEASAILVERLAEASERRPWLVAVTQRPTSEPGQLAIGRTVVVEPLDDDEARALAVAGTPATPLRAEELEALVVRANGNPLFLEEILRLVRATGSAESIPQSLEAVVGAELDSLHPFVRQVLRYTSVLGIGFRRTVVHELLAEHGIEVDDGTLRELARFIVADGDDRWRFRHPVTQYVIYNGLSYGRRRELHRGAGNVIERMAGEDTDTVAGLLAMHFSQAGEHDRAWAYGLVAGRRARQAYANVEAGGHFERALEAARHLPAVLPATRVEVLVDLGDVRELSGQFEQSLDAYRSAFRLTDDPVDRADLLLRRARARMHVGAYRVALGEATRGLRLLESMETAAARRVRAQLRALQALLRQAQQRAGHALALAAAAIAEASDADADAALARAYLIADWAHQVMGSPELAVHGEQALAIYERLGDLDGVGNVLNNLGADAYFDGDWGLAVQRYTKARDTYLRAGNHVSAAVASTNLGELLVSKRRFDEAEQALVEAVRVLRAANAIDDVLFADMQLGRLLVERGETDAAIERLLSLRNEARSVGQLGYAFEAAIHLASGYVASGRADEALALLAQAAAEVDEVDGRLEPAVARVRALAEAQRGRRSRSDALIEEGLEVARVQGLRYEEAMLLFTRVDLDRQEGRDPAAEDLTAVRSFFEQHGVSHETTEEVLRGTGQAPPRREG